MKFRFPLQEKHCHRMILCLAYKYFGVVSLPDMYMFGTGSV